MSKIWEPKTTTITEVHNLKKLTWDKLLGILRVHEIHLQDRSKREASTSLDQGLKAMVKAAFVKQKETQALKALQKEEIEISKVEFDNSTDEEISFDVPKFKHILKSRGQRNKRFP